MTTLPRRHPAIVAALLALAITAGAAGCAPSSASSADAAASGGTLRAAFPGGGAAETLDYLVGPTALDYVRARLVYAPFCEIDASAADGVAYGALSSIDVSPDLSSYTLHVRPDVPFTDGSTLTAADVIYSLRAPGLLHGLPFTQIVARDLDVDAATAVDDLTVTLPTRHPVADGRQLICQSMLAIKDGTTEFTESTPSSGPFTISGFEPGRSTVLTRNATFYGNALGTGPTLDSIELLSISDQTAREDALRQGQVDYASGLAPAQAQELTGASGITVSTSELPYASSLQFVMNPASAPFADERVREAFKLAIDRQQIVDTVYFGHAFAGDDVPGLGFPSYDTTLPVREHDPDKARALLAEAGQSGMAVTLTAGPELPGMVEPATLIVQDLRAIGVDATLAELPAGQLYADYAAYQKLPFAAGYTPPALFEPNHVPGALPEADALVAQARSAVTPEARLAASHEAQQILWAKGYTIAPVFVPSISAQSDGVSGVRELQFPDLSRATVTRASAG